MGSSMSKTAVESNNSMNTTFDTTTTANNQINNETTQLSGEEYEILEQIQSSEAMPQYRRQETFQEKAFRKFTQEPLIPIGCLTTAYFLGSGIRSFYNRDSIRSQKMMRARVGAQFMTLLFLAGYAGMNAINFDLTPGNRWKVDGDSGDNEKKEN